MYLVWAYHYTLDVNEITDTFTGHDPNTRGGMEYTFIDEKYTIVGINDNYRLYWAYDSANEMFYFTVVVQTTGWIAFGVSTQRGGMNGYDVMVGGVDSSGNGYIAVSNLGRVRLGSIWNKNNWNNASKRLFGSYSHSRIPGFPFRLFCSQEQNSRNIFQNTCIFLFRNIPNERALSHSHSRHHHFLFTLISYN